jgi:hypothetical protein
LKQGEQRPHAREQRAAACGDDEAATRAACIPTGTATRAVGHASRLTLTLTLGGARADIAVASDRGAALRSRHVNVCCANDLFWVSFVFALGRGRFLWLPKNPEPRLPTPRLPVPFVRSVQKLRHVWRQNATRKICSRLQRCLKSLIIVATAVSQSHCALRRTLAPVRPALPPSTRATYGGLRRFRRRRSAGHGGRCGGARVASSLADDCGEFDADPPSLCVSPLRIPPRATLLAAEANEPFDSNDGPAFDSHGRGVTGSHSGRAPFEHSSSRRLGDAGAATGRAGWRRWAP